MNKIWLIGAGAMAQDYAEVLQGLDKEFIVIGRSESSAKKFQDKTNIEVIVGGLNEYIELKPTIPTHAIVSVGVEKLFETTKELLEYGVKFLLVEKPGSMRQEEFEILHNLAEEKNAKVIIAYNRRFYASTLKALEIIKKDGGVTSFNFEFTEWGHVIAPLEKAEGVKEKWFLGNSTHVVDLAFFLGGKPKDICTFTNGSLDWHPTASVFSGAGVSDKNALFSYQANWESAGRWSVEILTKENRLILRPMEKLQIQKRGTIPQIFDETIDYSLDDSFKPGLYLQTKNFLNNEFDGMCSIQEQYRNISLFEKIANYS